MLQYLENLEQAMRERGATTLEAFARDKLANLERAANQALRDPRFKKAYHPHGLPKVESALEPFDCVAAPCREQCAVCQDIPEYAWWIGQGEFDRALKVIFFRNPLPGVTGYVCTHLCQSRCTRNNYDEPVAIRALKRFAADRGSMPMSAKAKSGHKVAVIGSGPSGLAAAWFLALSGVQVTIFESKAEPGGMMRIAPEFRLPAAVVDDDIARITALGVEIKLGHAITTPPDELLDQGFDAVYVACGFPNDARLDIEGIEAPGVFAALEVLELSARGEKLGLGSEVLVIGGGNTAVDAARTARRITGKPVTVVYRRTQNEMPATEEEKEALFAEGNSLVELASPSRIILAGGRVAALECLRNRLGEPGDDGRRSPVPLEGSEFEIKADSVIVAIGQRPDTAFLYGSAVTLHRDQTIAVEPQTGMAAKRGIYAGGDAVRGPSTVIQACADGRRAAGAICAQLGLEFAPGSFQGITLSGDDISNVKRVRARREVQRRPEMLPVDRRGAFDLVEQTLTESDARREAERCLQCSTLCDKCVEVCPNRANYTYAVSPLNVTLPRILCQDAKLTVAGEERFAVEQVRQIIHVDEFCNECGNCATFCVHEGEPYREKPRLFLTASGFHAEADNAFYVEEDDKGWTIKRREDGKESWLSVAGGAEEMVFENDRLRVTLSPSDFSVQTMELKQDLPGVQSLVGMAEMYVILKGITASLPFLPFGKP